MIFISIPFPLLYKRAQKIEAKDPSTSDMLSSILSEKKNAMHPGEYSGIHVNILSDSNFGILSGILYAILPRILSGNESAIYLSDFLPGILSGIQLGNLPGIASTNPCYI